MTDMPRDSLTQRSTAQEAPGQIAPDFDFDADFDLERSRRLSTMDLHRVAAQQGSAQAATTAQPVIPRDGMKGVSDDLSHAEENADAIGSAKGVTSAGMPHAGDLRAAHTTTASGAQTKKAGAAARAPAGPTQVTLDPGSLRFDAVAGRATLSREVTITNNSNRYLGGMPRIEAQDASAAAFSIELGRHGFIAPPERDNKEREKISVRYHAPAAGTHNATLIVPTDLGELRISLEGRALDIGAHAKTLGDGKSPEPLHDLAEGKPKNRAQGRARAMAAADAVSSLARTFETTVIDGGAARDHFAARLLAAGANLNARILGWVHEEGLDRVEDARQAAQGEALDFIKYVAGKSAGAILKVASKENIILTYALEAIDLGLSVVMGRRANQAADAQSRNYEKHMGGVTGLAIPASDAATKALAISFASLMSKYAVARTEMFRLASQEAQRAVGKLHVAIEGDSLVEEISAIEHAQNVMHDFKSAQGDWAQALKQIAAAGIKAQQISDTGFNALMEKYIEFRAGGNREIADHERQVSSRGYIDFAEPWNIQLTGFTFGQFNDPSSTVLGIINHKQLADLAFQPGNPPRKGWDVDVRLEDVNRSGAIVLKQGSAGVKAREHAYEGGIEERVRAIGGVEKLWSLLDSATLGTRVIWGRNR